MTLIYGKDEQALEAAKLLKDHLDVTVLIKTGADVLPLRVTDFPIVKGTHPLGHRLSRRFRRRDRRLRHAQAVVTRCARLRRPAQRDANALRHLDRSLRRRAAVSRPPICATAICAPIPAIRRRCCAPC